MCSDSQADVRRWRRAQIIEESSTGGLRLSYDGLSDYHDDWVNRDSSNIAPPGFVSSCLCLALPCLALPCLACVVRRALYCVVLYQVFCNFVMCCIGLCWVVLCCAVFCCLMCCVLCPVSSVLVLSTEIDRPIRPPAKGVGLVCSQFCACFSPMPRAIFLPPGTCGTVYCLYVSYLTVSCLFVSCRTVSCRLM